jgi:hypothetical protein
MNLSNKEFIKSQKLRKLNFQILQSIKNKIDKMRLLIFLAQILQKICMLDILDQQYKVIAFVEYLNFLGTMFIESIMLEIGELNLEC